MKKILLEDDKIHCLSLIDTFNTNSYIELVEAAYRDKGGIVGQRTPLKTKTAQTIRERMVDDICNGAVLPPVVIGLVVNDEQYEKIKKESIVDLKELFREDSINGSLCIIDGMQRTTALLEAMEKNSNIASSQLRVEFWIATKMNSLIYRMLVLNTGQVPWDIKRQLDTIYEPIVTELKKEIPGLDVRLVDQTGRRTDAGQYKSSKLIEYFLCYTSRKYDVEIKERVAEDFARMDAIAATSDNELLDDFKEIIKLLVSLDHCFGRSSLADSYGRFKTGKDIFTSIPAGVGFMSAAAVYIYGPPGFELKKEKIIENKNNLILAVQRYIYKLSFFSDDELCNLLELDLLNEKLGAKASKIGTFEREFFFKAFETFFKYSDEILSMKPCWSAK